MVEGVSVGAGDRVLDVAAGTGLITRRLAAVGADVVSLDQSHEMLARAVERGAIGIVATAEELPFVDDVFDATTFGYLLRYVDSVPGVMAEMARVVRPGGRIGMVEFGRPAGMWRPLWWAYTRIILPSAGVLISRPWHEVGSFLGPSIDAFADAWPLPRLTEAWQEAGLIEVTVVRISLGGGLVMTARKP